MSTKDLESSCEAVCQTDCVPTLMEVSPDYNKQPDVVSEKVESFYEPEPVNLDEEIEKFSDLRVMLLSLFDDAEKDLDSNPNAYVEMKATLMEAFLSSFSEETKRNIIREFLPKSEPTCDSEILA